LEVWFQRPKDIVRKLLSGDLDLGIVGLDILTEFGQVYIIYILLGLYMILIRTIKFFLVLYCEFKNYDVYCFC